MKSSVLSFLSVCLALAATGQIPIYHALKVVFLGNSYTYVNDLPTITRDIAGSMGDTLVTDGNTIGGYTLQQHSTDATSLAKIMQGQPDYVVLQEQSQLPSFPIGQVETDVFPYAHFLDSINHSVNYCGRTMFYMTWGRKNGDTSNCPTWPPVCTYNGMDSLLRLRYMVMADSNNATLSPVGAVWRYIRANYPAIDLYQADESHPLAAGSYAAACCFYTALFRKDPTNISYNYTLSAADAANIRMATKLVVYDSMLYWRIGHDDPGAHFTYSTGAGNEVTFTNTSLNAPGSLWYFGDGDSSTFTNPVHTYTSAGTYTVMLVAEQCNTNDTTYTTISTWPAGLPGAEVKQDMFTLSPNPAANTISLRSDAFRAHKYEIQVLDAMGRIMYRQTSSSAAEQVLDISALAPGMYLINVAEGQSKLYRKQFVKTAE